MRKNLFVSLIMLVAFSIVGCGGSGGGGTPTPTPTDFTAFTTAQKIDMAIGSTLPFYAVDPIIDGSASVPLKSISFKAVVPGACANESGSLDVVGETATYTNCQLAEHTDYTVNGEAVIDESAATITYNITGSVVYDSETYNVTLTGDLIIGDDTIYVDLTVVSGGTTYYVVSEIDTSTTATGPMNIAFGTLYAHCDLTNIDPDTQTFAEIMSQFGTDNCSNATADSIFTYAQATSFGAIFGSINASFMAAVEVGPAACQSGTLSMDGSTATFTNCEFVYNGETYVADGTITLVSETGTYTYDLDISLTYGGTDYSFSVSGPEIVSGEGDVRNVSIDFSVDYDSDSLDLIASSMTLDETAYTLSGDLSITNGVSGTCTFSDFEFAGVGLVYYQDVFLSSMCE